MDKPERPDKARRKARPDSAWLLVSGAVWRDADLQGRASSWERVILNAALDAGGGRLPPDPLDALPEQLVAAYLTEGASDRIEGILRRAAGGSSGEDDGRRRACAWFLLVACLLRQGRLAEAAAAYRDGERGCRALPGGPAYSAVAASALALRLAGDRSGSAGFREAFEILKLAAKPLARASCRRGRAEPAASGGSGSPAASGGSGPPADSGGSGSPAASDGSGPPAASDGSGPPAASGGNAPAGAEGDLGPAARKRPTFTLVAAPPAGKDACASAPPPPARPGEAFWARPPLGPEGAGRESPSFRAAFSGASGAAGLHAPFDLAGLILKASGAAGAGELSARASSSLALLAGVAGDFLTASRTASFFLSREGGQGGGASGGAGLPGLLRARLYAEALRDPAAQAGRLVAAASPPEEGRALLTARALAAMVRAATDQGRPVLAEGLLEELFALEDQDDDDLPYVKARAASMLAGLYSRKLMFSELQALYRKADALENFPGVAGEKFRAAARVISAYAAGGELGPALSLYRSLARLEGLEEFDSVRASAAAALSAAFAENGLLPEARGLYAIQGEFLDQDSGAGPVRDVPGADLLGLRAASADLIGHFEREMFRGEEEAEMEEAALADRAKAASCLMDAYSERGETGEALRVYGELRLPHSAELPPAERLLLALRLVNVCLRDGDVERAREIFRREALELPPLDHLQEGRASMAAALITALAARGDLDGARSVYDAVTFPGDGPKARHSRCSLEDTTIRVFAAAGQPARAARILKSPRFREACGSFPLKAARSALELAESFVRTGSLGEARAICESGVIEQGGNDGLTGRAMVTCSAITRLCLDGELETARRLFEELPQASRSRRSALYRVMASMSLREAYAETGNAEGLEFIARCVEGFNSLEAKLYGRRAGARGAAGSGQ